jgi:hypothetical protein
MVTVFKSGVEPANRECARKGNFAKKHHSRYSRADLFPRLFLSIRVH